MVASNRYLKKVPGKPNLSSKTVVDPGSGKVVVEHYFNGRRALTVELSPKRGSVAKQICGYLLIRQDLLSARDWVDMIQSIDERSGNGLLTVNAFRDDGLAEEKRNIRALFVAALTFYGKCFTDAREGRGIKIEKNSLSTELRGFHERFRMLRDDYAAHSGRGFDKSKALVLVDPRRSKATPPEVTIVLSQPISPDREELAKFRELIEHVLSVVDGKIDRAEEKLREMIAGRGLAYWRGKAK